MGSMLEASYVVNSLDMLTLWRAQGYGGLSQSKSVVIHNSLTQRACKSYKAYESHHREKRS